MHVCEDAVSHLRESLGFKDPMTLKAVSALSDYCLLDGNMEEAISLKTYVFESRKEVLGEDRRETLRAAASLVHLLIQDHQIEPALDLANQYFDRIRTAFGKVHPITRTFLQDVRRGLSEYDQNNGG